MLIESLAQKTARSIYIMLFVPNNHLFSECLQRPGGVPDQLAVKLSEPVLDLIGRLATSRPKINVLGRGKH
jgi:hypothetical protein